MAGDRMPIPTHPQSKEQVYWETHDGAIVGNVQPGPPYWVRLTGTHIEVMIADQPVVRLNGAGAARWLGLRLIEGAVIWEREVHTERVSD